MTTQAGFSKSVENARQQLNRLAGKLFVRQHPPFRMARGLIRPVGGLGINVVDHCNLSCLDCNHASPGVPERSADPRKLQHDLVLLGRTYKPGFLSLAGGEPLLHPDLPAVLRSVRASGITGYLLLTTNGTLLERMADEAWDLINELEISIYPGTPMARGHFERWRMKAARHKVRLSPFFYEHFRATFSLQGTVDQSLRQRIYRSCKIANVWGCHNLHEGYFYKCPQAIYAPAIAGSLAVHDPREDGVPILDGKDLDTRLLAYLASSEPLKACGYCLGNVGMTRGHRQVGTSWAQAQDAPTEALVDREKLTAAEAGVDLDISKRPWTPGHDAGDRRGGR